MPKSPLVYLREQLQFNLSEWKGLSDVDKDWYRKAAIEEMEVLGIEAQSR
ncbi:hypothetical protein LCGC14_2355100 [marine sediment metagenome]|uniref:Uncharacterized protein n=1 Tax=marine sediment metagenome TaxID=412755 RepID=A0A0F9C7Y9_9ZZZZ